MNYLAGDAFSLLPREGNSPSGLPEEWGVKPDMPHVCSIRLAGSGRTHVVRPLYFSNACLRICIVFGLTEWKPMHHGAGARMGAYISVFCE